MMMVDFLQLPEEIPTTGKVGDIFFTQELAKQKTDKNKGDTIVYYKIINVTEKGNIEYVVAYDILEEV